jgi:parallel beta-helix repeat protein
MRRRPRWLAYLKEPPMRVSSVVAAGSPTARLTALAAATMILATLASGAVVAGAGLLAGNGPLVVDPADPGAYQTISEAVADAADGDTVLVKPGAYGESVAISSDITLQGDGERGSVVLRFPADGPVVNEDHGGAFAYGILLEDSDAHVANLTVQGPEISAAALSAVYIVGGAPVVRDIDIVLPGDRFGYSGGAYYRRSAMRITGGSTATVSGSTWDGYVSINGGPSSAPTFEGNTITGQHISIVGGAHEPIIRGNTLLEGAAVRWEDGGSGGIAENNDITGFIGIDESEGAANHPTIRGNRIRGGGDVNAGPFAGTGIGVAGGATPLIEANEIQDAPTGILVMDTGADPAIVGNTIRGSSSSAIRVTSGASPSIEGNAIEDNAVGISVAGSSTPTMIGNTFCGNEEDLEVPEDMALTLGGSNSVCAS